MQIFLMTYMNNYQSLLSVRAFVENHLIKSERAQLKSTLEFLPCNVQIVSFQAKSIDTDTSTSTVLEKSYLMD